jgi:hypothetical protein
LEPPIQALVLLAILAASAIIFTVVFVMVADRELAKPEAGDPDEARGRREEDEARAGREGAGEPRDGSDEGRGEGRSEPGGEGGGRLGREEKDEGSGGGRGA